MAASLAALTFDTGTRYVLVDDAGGWKAAQLGPLEGALAEPTPDTVLVLLVRGKPLKQLVKLVEGAGGEVREEAAPKPWELPRWTVDRARELGLQLDGEAAKALVTVAGPGQLRIARELEKLALAVHPAAQVTAEQVEEHAAGDAAPQVYDLADALVAGDLRDGARPRGGARGTRRARPAGSSTHRAPPARGPPRRRAARGGRYRAAGRQGPQRAALAGEEDGRTAKKADRALLERALIVLADLEIELRGGGARPLDEDTAFSLALSRAAA